MAEAIRIEGLAALQKDLRGMKDAESSREVRKAMKEGAQLVASGARPLAARRTGKLAASFRAGAAGNTAFVRSRLPYAAVHEWGGVIRPKGAPITIRATPAATRALQSNEERIVEKVADAIDQWSTRYGWK